MLRFAKAVALLHQFSRKGHGYSGTRQDAEVNSGECPSAALLQPKPPLPTRHEHYCQAVGPLVSQVMDGKEWVVVYFTLEPSSKSRRETTV